MFVCVFFVFMLFIAPYKPGDPEIFEALKQFRTVGATAFLVGLSTYFFNRLHARNVSQDQWLTQCIIEIVRCNSLAGPSGNELAEHQKAFGYTDGLITAARHPIATPERKRLLRKAFAISKFADKPFQRDGGLNGISVKQMREVQDDIFATLYKTNKEVARWSPKESHKGILERLGIE